ncbi:Putative chitobiosyldiphosphodolichol beta-mannosyltransferase ALG1 [Septoria linicola]|uniref:Chitobiosyldiphosphodolichol beta-mannosyltransferase n=1 Tax=Septoria linicola TaxID=215465 RepID=A0A9Q9EMX8_9PEZI|nr:putative chitobiosyldiphosphodolichol beta-mannosyltransferase ALG1 [Septoria linicola]USW56505.1 Putative chitobiosyldiphosphodolichol beta-mannosyltransferase ALG1 [Septoria linicola]
MDWSEVLKQLLLYSAVLASAISGLLLFTLPKAYSNFDPGYVTEEDFTDEHKANAKKSGYAIFAKHKDAADRMKIDASVQIVVLGDIGRSPRMQYHALSIASHGGTVDIIGYTGSEVHPDILQSRLINIVPIQAWPKALQFDNRILFLLTAPFKVLWQIWCLYYALSYRTRAAKWMLIQNPPSIPTLAVARLVTFLRNTRLVIDWHNLGYSILALRLGPTHPLVRISEWCEAFFSRNGVYSHICVTNAMARVLKEKWGIQDALPLHDRPADIYQPLSKDQRTALLKALPATAGNVEDILAGNCRLLVSSTSWTPDEDFSILLDALVRYSNAKDLDGSLPNVIAIITGKGPQRDYYLNQVVKLTREKKLEHVAILSAWLPAEDYASLLGSADLGLSLHTSSSGVDLPMKVVDMFGAGLPVAGWSDFEAWPELVKEGVNGVGFKSSEKLSQILERLFGGDGTELKKLRDGAMKETKRRWDSEWMPVAGKLFDLRDT